jgi:hypothetical protein
VGANRGEVGRSTESVAGLMNESFRSGKPAERTDGRTEGIAGGNTRTQSHWAIEGRIESVRVKRSVRYVALAREGDRKRRAPDAGSRAQ